MQSKDGMSFAEFTYPLLQGWDWWHMYDTKGVQIQIGGSDQYGNIIAGMDAVKYIATHHHDPVKCKNPADMSNDYNIKPMGFTVPLLTNAAGAKFGKSAGNAVWLDKELTSPFELYKFFLRQADADMSRYLKLFTFMPIKEIDELVAEHMLQPSQRKAQHRLAREFVELVHGVEDAKLAETQHRLVYSGTISDADAAKVPTSSAVPGGPTPITLNNAGKTRITLPASLIHTKSIGRILVAAGLARSASEGHRLASSQGAYIGGAPGSQQGDKAAMHPDAVSYTPIKTWQTELTKQYLIGEDKDLLILRRGKHDVRIINLVSDEEWAAMKARGETAGYPGEYGVEEKSDNATDDLKDDAATKAREKKAIARKLRKVRSGY
jgi:tyrosyl-tRNA synthetase